MLEGKKYFSFCKVLKYQKYVTLPKIFLMVEIREQDLLFSICEVPKSNENYLSRMKMKEIISIYLRKVSDIGS